jgi:hypothetical protein
MEKVRIILNYYLNKDFVPGARQIDISKTGLVTLDGIVVTELGY